MCTGFFTALVRYLWVVREDRTMDRKIFIPFAAIIILFSSMKIFTLSSSSGYFRCRWNVTDFFSCWIWLFDITVWQTERHTAFYKDKTWYWKLSIMIFPEGDLMLSILVQQKMGAFKTFIKGEIWIKLTFKSKESLIFHNRIFLF